MFSKVHSIGILGVEGYPVVVEADVSEGLPGFTMVGYLSGAVREAQDRVRTALKNSGFRLPARKITVNLSPADIRKEGTGFDLPIAVAVLAATGLVDQSILDTSVLVGELGLDGRIKPVSGILSIVAAAGNAGKKRCFLPIPNVSEGQIIGNIDIIGVEDIRELAGMLNEPDQLSPAIRQEKTSFSEKDVYDVDFSEVNGQFLLKRATEIAVAGMHNILYIGPAGTGKTMVARRIPTIMPSLSHEENVEISKIYSICGLIHQDQPLLSRRPFRSPHHTISPQALTGGGRIPKPGEISLASRGVLFLDELPEFQKNSIEVLRQPLEERKITISRLHSAYEFPADFMLAAAMNPCKCGYYPDRSRCTCTEPQIQRYLSRISKPLLDRIDICAEAVPMKYEELKDKGKGEPSGAIRERIEAARVIQRQRFEGSGIYFNSAMNGAQIGDFCRLGQLEQVFLKRIFEHMGLSARGYGKILKVARTIADLEGSGEIKKEHLAEAVGLRSLEEKYWGGSHHDII